jgi:uncharacterized membrane protein
MENPPPNQSGNENAKTALGLDANLGAALGYPIGIVALIIFIMEKENRFARFHALQSLLYHVAAVVLFIVLGIVLGILTAVLSMIDSSLGGIVGILLWLVFMVVVLIYLAGLLFCAFKAYGGNLFKLPIIGNMAEKIINK